MKMPNGKLWCIRLSIAASVILLGGCQSLSHNRTLTDKHQKKIVVPVYHCVSSEGDINNVLPAALYENMNTCIARESWSDAIYLYARAGSSTWYDAVQVETQYARSMHSRLLKESIDALDNNQRNNFWRHLQATMSDTTKKEQLCEVLIASGAPTYRPDYMLLSASKDAERGFPIAKNWEKAVYSYVGCGSEKSPDIYTP